jgi:hypothetical protein
MTPEDEEFNRIERESKVRQEYIKDMNRKPIGLTVPYRDSSGKTKTPEEVIAQLRQELGVMTEMVRALSARIKELEKQCKN